jgi:hypothetical protein
MTRHSATRRWLALALGAALAVGVLAGPAMAEDRDNDVTVRIPTLPAPTPTSAPTPLPPTTVTPTTPGGDGSGSGSGTGTGSGTGATDVPAADAPAADTGEPAIGSKPGKGDRLVLDRDFVMPGEVVVATATGLAAGEMAQMVLFSDPVLIGNVPADADGAYRAEITIPEDTEPGRHTLQLTGWTSTKIYVGTIVVGDPDAAVASGFSVPLWLWWIVAAILLAILVGLGARAAWSVRRSNVAGAAS